MSRSLLRYSLLSALLISTSTVAFAQERLQKNSRYQMFERMTRQAGSAITRGDLQVSWDPSGKRLYYSKNGKSYIYDIDAKQETEGNPPQGVTLSQGRGDRRGRPERGRQFASETSPDGTMKATSKNRNVYISKTDGSAEQPVTTDGSETARTKYGIASWVYGEELGVRDAMWWSPDSTKLAYYKFDESKVKDYYIAYNQLDIQDTLNTEAYPKAGADNPSVDLYVYDLKSKLITQVHTHFDGGDGTEVGTYIYNVQWSPDGTEILFNRTNRKQNDMEFCAANPKTGDCRVILREKSKTWVDNAPALMYLDENRPGPKRFLWHSERNGFYNWYLYDLSGKQYNAVTTGQFEAGDIISVDTQSNLVYYMGRDGANPYRLQLHRVHLDGTGDQRLTDPLFNHRVSLSPSGKYFTDAEETMDSPPITNLVGLDGKVIAKLADSDLSNFQSMNMKKGEVFTFTAGDGKTTCYGTLYKPTDFDPNKKYPLVVSVYGGPDSGPMGFGGQERFGIEPAYTELGFLVATIDGRGTTGRGMAFKDPCYGNLGITEIDDQAAGAKALASRPYVDPNKVGIFGTSYGGYASAMAILRHPEVFKVAVACSPVTDWRNYDTIYTERYMGLPWDSENKRGYDLGSCMPYAKTLQGHLMLYYGTADNNVHPSNTIQLAQALEDAGKPFDMNIGPDQGHSQMGFSRILEYFLENFGMSK